MDTNNKLDYRWLRRHDCLRLPAVAGIVKSLLQTSEAEHIFQMLTSPDRGNEYLAALEINIQFLERGLEVARHARDLLIEARAAAERAVIKPVVDAAE
jgi:hypothetical protein